MTREIVDYNSWVIINGQIIRYCPALHKKYLMADEVYTLSVAVKVRKEGRRY